MNNSTLLLRQIHPGFVQDGRPSSQAFRPTPKDEQRLSVYDGDQITPADAFYHYTKDLMLGSSGVLAVTLAECETLELPVTPDPAPFPEHALIDFSAYNKNATEKKAKLLKAQAEARGWLYREVMT
ncbi:hypothetical protein [Desulfomicrobium apsheronum]|uniref:hypothetical protein n=1 Tax=Desulfomicrobium apsheronum TaxID=52560 RepID=UPI000AE144C3|nr:hypothetical protein [Desulfomicrobium apsheronum]MDY0282164.1 hypothetical protein [Salinivirgaceae bacterium]